MMTESLKNIEDVKSKLIALQTQFVESVLTAPSNSHHLLIAPPGTGKTHVTVNIAKRSIAEKGAKRILFLYPARGIAEYQKEDISRSINLRTIFVDGKKYREFMDGLQADESPWPNHVVIIMTIDFAKREDVAEVLSKQKWDLIVIEEAHRLSGQRMRLVKLLLQSSSTACVVLSSCITCDLDIDNLAVTTWSSEQYLSPSKEQLCLISYDRSAAEISLLSDLTGLLSALSDTGVGGRVAHMIMTSAASSLSALESSVLFLKDAKIRTNEPFFKGEEARPEAGSEVKWTAEQSALLDSILNGLDQVSADPKYEALVSLLKRRREDHYHKEELICIWTQRRDTGRYLLSNITEENDASAKLIDGSMSPDQKYQVLHEWRISSSILIITDASVKGLELPSADAIIYYDLPETTDDIYIRQSRFNEHRKPLIIDVYAFQDTTNAWPHERELLALHGFIAEEIRDA